MYPRQNARQNHDMKSMKTVNRSFENAAGFRYLGTTVTNQNLIVNRLRAGEILGILADAHFTMFCLP
jgi:hypothetical protein